MTDIALVLILLAISGCAVFYIYNAKKSGQKCIGCPYSGKCGKGCSCNAEK